MTDVFVDNVESKGILMDTRKLDFTTVIVESVKYTGDMSYYVKTFLDTLSARYSTVNIYLKGDINTYSVKPGRTRTGISEFILEVTKTIVILKIQFTKEGYRTFTVSRDLYSIGTPRLFSNTILDYSSYEKKVKFTSDIVDETEDWSIPSEWISEIKRTGGFI